MNIKEKLMLAHQRKAEIVQEMREIIDAALAGGDRDLTVTEGEEFDALETKAATVSKDIERFKALLDKEASLSVVREISGNGEGLEVGSIEGGESAPVYEGLGQQLHDVFLVAQPGGNAEALGRLNDVRAAAIGMGESVPADGGFLVQQTFIPELIKATYETAVLPGRCRRLPVGPNANGIKMPAVDESSRADGSRWGGVLAYWEGEGDAQTHKKPAFGSREMTLKKLTGLCYATDEMIQDVSFLGAFITEAFGDEFGFKLDDAIIRGTGAGMPLGVLESGSLVTVAKETGQAAATIVTENIDNMYARAWARGLFNMVWLINQDCQPQLDSLYRAVGTGGVPAYMPPGGVAQAPYGQLKGRPVIPIEQCETLGTVGDLMLVDLSQYLLIDKGGIKGDTSIHVRFTTDETAFRFIYRVDGMPLWTTAKTPYKGTDTVSPFLALATRA